MATTPRKSRSKSTTPRKSPATRRGSAPVLTAVEGGAGKAAAPETPAEVSPAPATLAPAAAPVSGTDATDGAGTPTLAKRDLFARVTAATGAKKKDVRLIAEATLAVLGQALSDGEELNLPPLGKMRIVKSRDAGGAEVVTLKLRRKHGLAEPALSGGAADEDDD